MKLNTFKFSQRRTVPQYLFSWNSIRSKLVKIKDKAITEGMKSVDFKTRNLMFSEIYTQLPDSFLFSIEVWE